MFWLNNYMTDKQYETITAMLTKQIDEFNKHALESAQIHAAMLDAFSAPFIRVEDEVQRLSRIENRRSKLLSKFLKRTIKKHPA